MTNNIRDGVTSHYPSRLQKATARSLDRTKIVQMTRDPGEQLKLGRTAQSTLSPPSPLLLSSILKIPLNPVTGFGEHCQLRQRPGNTNTFGEF